MSAGMETRTSGSFRRKSTTVASGVIFVFVLVMAAPNTTFKSSLLTSLGISLVHV